MINKEAMIKVRGYLTDSLPIEYYDEIEEIMSALEQKSCEDKIENFIKHKIDYLEELASIETNEGRWREEEKYLYAVSVLEEVVECMNTSGGEAE